jgi:acetyl esterase
MPHARHPASRLLEHLRVHTSAFLAERAFRSVAALGALHPDSRPERHGVEVLRDVPYHDTGRTEHLCDIYRPATGTGPWPVVLYVHGGGFALLSKDTHWVMALHFARRGFLVVSINYRLAPRHRYPAATEDACTALEWVVDNAARYGGDPSRLVLAGESAGANLVTMLAVASAYRRPEPWARRIFDRGIRPGACLPACGILQVSDVARFSRRRKLPRLIAGRIHEIASAYLGEHMHTPGVPHLDLADPLVLLERGVAPERPLPAFFAAVGTRDPILDDTRRLAAALVKLGVPHRVEYYPGELHAFHALFWRQNARHYWAHVSEFIQEHLPAPASAASHAHRSGQGAA